MSREIRMGLMNDVIQYFLVEEKEDHPTINSINEGSCGDFAHMVNEGFKQRGLSFRRYLFRRS